jgi:predicted deacylase
MAPRFELAPPDLARWRRGNTGVDGVWRFEAAAPGRDVLVSALVHGNELCGAWALAEALQHGLRPRRGALTLAFANLDAFDRFDAAAPHASRCVDADLNRLWGAMAWRADPARWGSEHRRVLALQPFVERSQWLLDLHSMHEPGPPLAMVGPLAHHAAQASQLGAPALLVADGGHRAGCRLRDHGAYGDAGAAHHFALLVECGYHGAAAARAVALDALARFVAASGVVDAGDVPAHWRQADSASQRLLQVTEAVTVAAGDPPRLARPWRNGETVHAAGTLIGWNGGAPVRTPYAGCVLVMPTLVHAAAGATLVRFARAVEPARPAPPRRGAIRVP